MWCLSKYILTNSNKNDSNLLHDKKLWTDWQDLANGVFNGSILALRYHKAFHHHKTCQNDV